MFSPHISNDTTSSNAYYGVNPPVFDNSEKLSAGSILFLDIFPINNGHLPAATLPNTLKKYLDFIILSQEALAKFEKRVMPFFDPVGGENACQIRAAMFAEMLNREGTDELIRSALKQLADHAVRIKDLINNLNVKSLNVNSFKDFLQQNGAILEISVEISVIISSFVLSETKIVEYKPNDFGVPSRHERILGKKFSEKKGIIPNFAKAIISTAQTKLSELSVKYIQRLALRLLLSKEDRAASLVFGKNVKLDERHRQLTPCFPTMCLLLDGMHRNKIPLVLKIKQFLKGQSEPYGLLTFVFGNQGTGDYTLLNKNVQLFQKGSVFIHAKSITESTQSSKALEEKVLKQNITEYIKSDAAAHSQFGCDDKNRPEDPLCDRYRRLAHEWGTCRSNPSLFMIEHICCDIIDIDSKGSFVQTIYISSKQKVEEMYDTISDIGDFIRPRLRLISEGKSVPTATFKNKELVDLTMAETSLKNGCTLYALEFRHTPHQRIYPDSKFKLIITD